MNTLMIALTVYMTCCIPAIESQIQPALSVSVSLTVGADQAEYRFNGLVFDRFYHCLRNEDYVICDAAANVNGDVVLVRGCIEEKRIESSDRFTCRPTVGGLNCKRGDSFVNFKDSECLLSYSIDIKNTRLSQQVRMTWVGVDTVAISSYRSDIIITNLPNNTFVIQETVVSAQLITTLPTREEQDTDDGDNTGIIIGALIAVIVVLAVTLILVIILWRRKMKASTSAAATKNTKNSDTFIYLNDDINNDNVRPDSNSRLEQTGSENLNNSYMNAREDADEELKKIRTVSQVSNDTSISQDSNQDTGINANANSVYTEIDTDPATKCVSGHYVNQNDSVNPGSDVISKSSSTGPGYAYYNFL